MIRLLVDENYPHSAARGLVEAGHDVWRVAALTPGLPDRGILALAREQQRCLVTFDSDFGDLVFQHGEEPPPCIVYLRLHPIAAHEVLALTLQSLQERLDGQFIVATTRGLRRRPFVAWIGNRGP